MSKKEVSAAIPPGLHDLVWAKVEGYHYWPAVVCSPPSWESERNRTDWVHVRFFDPQASRAWVKIRLTKPFTGPWHRQVPQKPSKRGWAKGVAEADKALSLDPSERPALFPPYDQAGSGSEEDDPLEVSAESRSTSVSPSESSEGSDLDYKPSKATSRNSSSGSKGMGGSSILNLESRKKVLQKKAPKRKPLGPRSTELSSPTKRAATPKSTRGASRQANKRGAKPGAESTGGDGAAVQQLDFLKDGMRRDACGRLVDHPEFSPRTLRIPESFKAKLAPAMRQWWEVKAEHFDAVIFFKVGRVYELYHMDAVIGVEQLGLALT